MIFLAIPTLSPKVLMVTRKILILTVSWDELLKDRQDVFAEELSICVILL